MDETALVILSLVARSKNLPPEAISPASTFDELQIDSLDKINLTFEVEERFAIQIPDNSLSSLRTIADVIAGVKRLQAEKLAAADLPASATLP